MVIPADYHAGVKPNRRSSTHYSGTTHSSDSEALAFLISSQLHYLERESHRREVVRIPAGATTFLRVESIIQCFSLESLSVTDLCVGFEQGLVTNAGKLPVRYLHKVREVVVESRLLSQQDIERAVRVLPAGTK